MYFIVYAAFVRIKLMMMMMMMIFSFCLAISRPAASVLIELLFCQAVIKMYP